MNSSGLPRPSKLKKALIVHIQYGKEQYKLLCPGASAVQLDFPSQQSEPIDCLYLYGANARDALIRSGVDMSYWLLPMKYVTSMTAGPEVEMKIAGREAETTILQPGPAASENALSAKVILNRLNDVMAPT